MSYIHKVRQKTLASPSRSTKDNLDEKTPWSVSKGSEYRPNFGSGEYLKEMLKDADWLSMR
jgi:hypothetical protein